ncbi:hypothetical protein [Wukongibacter sp. M2B1]|uniref:hypothetical protein n=1 Tax=Wukongibacter sp. M2B1 TaxID=3088895 RepID=UPI003D7A004F
MEDKTFELLTKMYSEMQSGLKEVRNEMQNGFKEVRQDIVRLESKMDENHKALYDGYIQNSEAITEIREDIRELKSRVENQEIELRVIRGGK